MLASQPPLYHPLSYSLILLPLPSLAVLTSSFPVAMGTEPPFKAITAKLLVRAPLEHVMLRVVCRGMGGARGLKFSWLG